MTAIPHHHSMVHRSEPAMTHCVPLQVISKAMTRLIQHSKIPPRGVRPGCHSAPAVLPGGSHLGGLANAKYHLTQI